MWASYLWHLFARPAKRVSPAAAIPVVPSAITRAPRAAAPDLVLQMSVTRTDTDLIIRVKGDARFDCARALSDGLLAPAACRSGRVTLDLSELHSISSLAMGVLVGFRRGVVRMGGRVRLADGLQRAVREA